MPNASGNPEGVPRFHGKDGLQLNRLQDSATRAQGIGGHNVLRRQTSSGVILSALSPRRGITSQCELYAFRSKKGHVRVTWGRVQGMQPAQFAGVRAWEFSISSTKYVYVSATYSDSTGQWSNPQIIASSSPSMTNTTTVAFVQIAACIVFDDGNLVVSSACGPVTLNTCDLAIDG